MTLPQIVYDTQHRLLARLSKSSMIRENRYTIAKGPAAGLRRKGGFGFLAGVLRRPTAMHAEESFIASLLSGERMHGRTILDVGADQGLYTIAFARAVGPQGRVIALEPNPESTSVVRDNVAVNDFDSRVTVIPAAAGDHSGTIVLTTPGAEGARSSADPVIAEGLRSEGEASEVTVPLVTISDVLRDADEPALAKIDVEGLEAAVLRGMHDTDYRPMLVIEMHGVDIEHKRANAREVFTELRKLGYESIHHLESRRALTTADDAAEWAYRDHVVAQLSPGADLAEADAASLTRTTHGGA